MALDLADPIVVATNDGLSASNSFLIAVVDEGDNVAETKETNNVAVSAKPGPPGIVLLDKLFGPDPLTIKVGTRVRWMHRDDGQDHTVTGGSCDTGAPSTKAPRHSPAAMIHSF
jgi:plastocyanin